jgi:hypothetical protein
VILKRDQVADILVDALTHLRYPLDDPPAFEHREIVPVASSLYREPDCWIRVLGWVRDGDEWIVRFERAPRPRELAREFLAPNGRTASRPGRLEPHPVGTDPDVVDRVREAVALCDEPEMISRAISSEYAIVANGHQSLRHAAAVEQARETRKDLAVRHRLADAHQRAKRQHLNVSTEVHIIGKAVDKAARGRRLDPAAVTVEHLSPGDARRLLALEALLDGTPQVA